MRRAWNSWSAASESHTTTEPESLPVNSPIGTVIAVVDPCSAHQLRQVPDMVTAVDGQRADGGVGGHRVPAPRIDHTRGGLLALCITAAMNSR